VCSLRLPARAHAPGESRGAVGSRFGHWSHNRLACGGGGALARSVGRKCDRTGCAIANVLSSFIPLLYAVEVRSTTLWRNYHLRTSAALARGTRSTAWLIPLHQTLMKAAVDPTILPHSVLAKAVHHALESWPDLTRFAEPSYGHLHIDSNAVENAIRVCAVEKLPVCRPSRRRLAFRRALFHPQYRHAARPQ